MKKLLPLLLLPVLIALILVYNTPLPPSSAPPAIPIKYQPAEQRNVPVILNTIGSIAGSLSIEIRPQVSGQILETHVEEGEWVKKGQLLFTLDPSLYAAALNKAKGTLAKDKSILELSKVKLQRNAELVKKNFISAVVYDELKSNVEAQEAQVSVDQADVDTAQINLDRTQIYAFADGKIGVRNFDSGNIVSPTDTLPLTTLEYIAEVNVNFSLPETKFELVSKAQRKEPLRFEVFLPNDTQIGQTKLTEKKIGNGQVLSIGNTISTETGTFRLTGVAGNPDKLMWPGQFVQVSVILDVLKDAIVVPEEAIQRSQKGPFVWILKDDMTVKGFQVDLGERDHGWVVIKSGVKKGDKIVTLGQINLSEGAKVFIQSSNKEGS